jgi:hypothetical protein
MSQISFLIVLLLPGQTSSPAGGVGALLGPRIVDGHEGFALQPPQGWQLLRRREELDQETVLLRMIGPAGRGRSQEMIVLQLAASRRAPLEEVMRMRQHALEVEFSGVTHQSQQLQQIAGRPGAYFSATFTREGFSWLRMESIVQARPGRSLALQFTGPAEDSRRSELLFQAVLGTLELLPDWLDAAALRRALAEGDTWRETLKGRKLAPLAIAEQYFRIDLEGRAIGFLAVEEGAVEWQRQPGVRVRERWWTFDESGRAQRLQTNFFVADDFVQERWEASATTLHPATRERPAFLEAALEDGLRTDDLLISNQTYQLGQPTVQNPPLRLPPSYLSRVLVHLLPRLLGDLGRQRTLAFTAFDHPRADVVIKLFELKGPANPPCSRAKGKAFRIDVREGLAGEITSLFVDEGGKILCIQAGPARMTPVPVKDLERAFAGRIAAAEKEMAALEKAYQADESRFGRGAGGPRP